MGKIESYINQKIENDGAILSVVIDPVDYPEADDAIETGISANNAGADIIAIGGSMGAQGELLDAVVKGIKAKVSVPVVLFPGNIATVSKYADAIYFMTLLNSRNPYWFSQAQMLSAPLVKQYGIESLATGYILIEPGGTAGWVGDANIVPRDKPKIAAAIALAGQLSGKKIIFTDAGSAAFAPIPTDMVSAVAQAIDIPYLVAGGIKTPEQASDIVKAGADWVQIGTAVENISDVESKVKAFVKSIKDAGKSRQ